MVFRGMLRKTGGRGSVTRRTGWKSAGSGHTLKRQLALGVPVKGVTTPAETVTSGTPLAHCSLSHCSLLRNKFQKLPAKWTRGLPAPKPLGPKGFWREDGGTDAPDDGLGVAVADAAAGAVQSLQWGVGGHAVDDSSRAAESRGPRSHCGRRARVRLPRPRCQLLGLQRETPRPPRLVTVHLATCGRRSPRVTWADPADGLESPHAAPASGDALPGQGHRVLLQNLYAAGWKAFALSQCSHMSLACFAWLRFIRGAGHVVNLSA